MKTPFNFGQKIILKLTEAETLFPVAPRRKVGLSTRVAPATYLHLKQAGWWVPGLVEEDFIDEAIREKLARTPGAEQALPPAELTRLRQQKKLSDSGM